MIGEEFSTEILRKTFSEITKGFSFGLLGDEIAYIKHLDNTDQIDIDAQREAYIKESAKKKLPNIGEVLERLNIENIWTNEDEDSIRKQKEKIDNLITTRKNMAIPSQSKIVQDKIDEENEKLNIKLFKKRNFLGQTQESYAEAKLNSYYIRRTIFKDEKFTVPFFSKEDFDNLDDEDFFEINSFYEHTTQNLSIDHIEHLVINNFFLHFFSLVGDDVSIFFKKPLYELTFLQLNVLHIALRFRNILRDCGGVPDNIKNNPKEIIKHYENTKNIEKLLESSGLNSNDDDKDKASIKSLVGAKQDDLNKMGLSTINKNMREKAIEKGGRLNKYDMAKLMGTKI